MRIHLSAPIEIQNLLPYDFKYMIYDKKTKKDWSNFLRKGGVSPVHVVNLAQLLLVSVDLQDTPFKQSEYAIINSPDREFSREKTLVVKDNRDLTLRLKLHYLSVILKTPRSIANSITVRNQIAGVHSRLVFTVHTLSSIGLVSSWRCAARHISRTLEQPLDREFRPEISPKLHL